jgi:hypothetical protein
MDPEEDDISLYVPRWKANPVPYQPNDPVAPPVRHGFPDDTEGILDSGEGSENVPEGGDDGAGLGVSGLGGQSGVTGASFASIVTETTSMIRYNATIYGALISPV